METKLAEGLAKGLMSQHGLAGWRFRWDRAVRRLGLCNYRTKTISLSYPLASLNPDYQVKNTILHEIAHALVGSMNGHNNVWRAKAMSIGCNGERCTNSLARIPTRYNVLCKVCNVKWGVHRKPRNLAGSYHRSCGRASLNQLVVVNAWTINMKW